MIVNLYKSCRKLRLTLTIAMIVNLYKSCRKLRLTLTILELWRRRVVVIIVLLITFQAELLQIWGTQFFSYGDAYTLICWPCEFSPNVWGVFYLLSYFVLYSNFCPKQEHFVVETGRQHVYF